MAGSYTLPQVRVFQEFSETPNDVTQHLNPFVIGPNYHLIRYSEKNERSDCQKKALSAGTATVLAWKAGVTGTKVDKSWYKVTLEDAYVQYGSQQSSSCLDKGTGTTGMKFEFTMTGTKTLDGANGTEAQFGVAVKAGDFVAVGTGADQKIIKIRSVSCGTLGTSERTSSIVNKSTGASAEAILSPDVGGYTGESDVTVTIKVDTSASKITWRSDVSGISSTGDGVAISTSVIQLGKGIKITPAPSPAAGQYVLTIKVVEPVAKDTITLVAPVAVGSTQPTFKFLRFVDSVDVDDSYLVVADSGVTVDANVKVDIGTSSDKEVLKATAYLSQRNMSTAHKDGVYSISTDADIIRELGAISPDNPLAYALHVMRLNCASATIKYTAVESDDLEGYAKALDRASVTTDVYAFCPLTDKAGIIDAVVAHCDSLSTPEEKSWRISFVSKPTDRYVDVTPNVAGLPEKCKVNGQVLTCYNGVTSTVSNVSHFTSTVAAGDSVTVIVSTTNSVTTTVESVTSDTELKLKDTITGASSSNCRFFITHYRDTAEYVSAVAATSAKFANHRVYNVFPNTLVDSDGNTVGGMYAAAAVCALACSVAPQQPITNVEINGFSDLPAVYSDLNRDQLNEIAAGGTLILMQDKIGGKVYVRHQISTAYSDGNLNTAELSMIKNLDSISFYFANRFAPYIGRYNLTDELLTELMAILKDGLAYLETSTETNRLIGPQVLSDGTEIRSLYRDTSEKDRAYADVSLNLPAPFNNFDLRLNVI